MLYCAAAVQQKMCSPGVIWRPLEPFGAPIFVSQYLISPKVREHEELNEAPSSVFKN